MLAAGIAAAASTVALVLLFQGAASTARSAADGACGALRPSPLAPGLRALEPDFTLPDLRGQPVSMRALRGRPVLVSFFATWCPPCVEEAPGLDRLARRLGDKATVLVVSVDEQIPGLLTRLESERLKYEIERGYGVSCRVILADFARLADIRAAAEELAKIPEAIDILVHNAGVYNTKRIITADGLEEVFQVDYLASFAITYALLGKLRREGRARVVLVNSEGHRFAIEGLKLDDLDWGKRHYTGLRSYGSAKTAQLLAMRRFAELLSGSGATINAMHPGDVRTAMGENNGRIYRFLKRRLINPGARDPELSAKANYYLAAAPVLSGVSGRFFNFTTEETPAPHALDLGIVARVWEESLRLGGLS